MSKHVLVLIHGITPEKKPRVREQYEELLRAIERAELPVEQPIVQVSWGVPATGGPASDDQYLTPAEAFVSELLGAPPHAPSADAIAVPGRDTHDWGVPGLRWGIEQVRNRVVQFGLSDAIYYAAPDGERAVRQTVFEQVFDKLEAEKGQVIYLHIVAHSLGVTIAHDFLYALFGSHDPDFPKEPVQTESRPLEPATRDIQADWRQRAVDGELKLGTFISYASQLPLFVMRKQALVKRLAGRRRLDPSVIGIDASRRDVQWAIFYDADELLGFPTSNLYEPTDAIRDLRMNSGLDPLHAHTDYWTASAIVKRTVAILRQNMRG
jgi:hypothetical protein